MQNGHIINLFFSILLEFGLNPVACKIQQKSNIPPFDMIQISVGSLLKYLSNSTGSMTTKSL
jgi:hypothetical protein